MENVTLKDCAQVKLCKTVSRMQATLEVGLSLNHVLFLQIQPSDLSCLHHVLSEFSD